MLEWQQEGLPTVLRAISGWADHWGLAATVLLGEPEGRLWTSEERSELDQAIAEGRGWTGASRLPNSLTAPSYMGPTASLLYNGAWASQRRGLLPV